MAARFDAFISYAREDEEFVDGRLVPALAERGKTTWVDRENLPMGAEFPSRIEAAIRQAAAFVFVLSPDSAASDWCRRELEEAARQHKRLVPIVVREIEVAAVPRAMRNLTWVRWLATADDERAAGQVFDALEDTAEWREQQAEIATRAHEWRLRGDRGSLLRGRALKDAERWLIQAGLFGRRAPPTPEQVAYIASSRQAERRWRRWGISALLGVVTVTSVLAVFAWQQRGQALDNERVAREQTGVAQSRELAANARAQLTEDPQLALILSLVAVETSATDAAEETLRMSLAAVRGWGEPDTVRFDVPVVAFGPAGSNAVTRGPNGRLGLRTLKEPSRTVLTMPPGEPLVSPDGQLLAVRSVAGALQAWRVTGEPLGQLGEVEAADFRHDGSLVAAVGRGLLEWNPVTSEVRAGVALKAGVRSVIAVPQPLYATVDDRRVALWSPYREEPTSEYEEPDGIDRSWPSPDRTSVVVTNARGTAVIHLSTTPESRVPLRSLRAVAFDPSGELILAVPSSGPPALVRVKTGGVISRLPVDAAGATAVAFAGESILVATGAEVKRYPCAQCAPLRTVVENARRQIARPLTQAERELFLRERPTNPCPVNDLNADPCLEVFPDSGPPRTVVEVRGLGVGEKMSLIDATGTTWGLGTVDPPMFYGLAAARLGTVTIPKNIPQGSARIVSPAQSGSRPDAERAFRVTCAWCYEPQP